MPENEAKTILLVCVLLCVCVCVLWVGVLTAVSLGAFSVERMLTFYA